MAIAATVQHYLEAAQIGYSIVRHSRTETSAQSASSAHVAQSALAKAVLLEHTQGFLLAVLPASCTLDLEKVERAAGRHVELASETALADVFDDCECGSVPAIGVAYGVETFVEDALRPKEEIFFEAGDHEVLLGVEGGAFRRLMSEARFGSFCRTG